MNSATSKKESSELIADSIFWMIHYFLEKEQICLSGDVYQKHNKVKLLINVMYHHIEDIL